MIETAKDILKGMRLMCLTVGYSLLGFFGIAYIYIGLLLILNLNQVEYLTWLNFNDVLDHNLNTQLLIRTLIQLFGHVLILKGMFLWYVFVNFYVSIRDIYAQVQ